MVVFDSRGPRPLPDRPDENRDFLPLPPGSLRFNKSRVRALFDAIDVDGTGIDVGKLEVYFQELAKRDGVRVTADCHLGWRGRNDGAERLSRDLLADCKAKDGKLDYETFEQFVLQRELELWGLFQTLDVSGDGRLDREELRSALVEELQVSLHEQNRFIDDLEAHSPDGKVGFATFRDLLLLNPDQRTSLAAAYHFYAETRRFGHSLFGLDWIVLPREAARTEELQSKIVLATGVSAACSRFMTAPLDRIRLFYMLGGFGPAGSQRPLRRGTRVYLPQTQSSNLARFRQAIQQIAKDGGLIRGLWRGTAVNLVKVPLESSARVAMLGYLRFMIARREGIPGRPHDVSRVGMLMAAAGATAVPSLVLLPLDNIRTRMMSAVDRVADSETDLKALQDSKIRKSGVALQTSSHPNAAGARTVGRAAAQILTTQGFRGFWKGTPITLASIVPFVAISEALYDSLEKKYTSPGPHGYVG